MPLSRGSFYATDAGRQHFADQLTSIRFVLSSRTPPPPQQPTHRQSRASLYSRVHARCHGRYCVQETCNFDTLYA